MATFTWAFLQFVFVAERNMKWYDIFQSSVWGWNCLFWNTELKLSDGAPTGLWSRSQPKWHSQTHPVKSLFSYFWYESRWPSCFWENKFSLSIYSCRNKWTCRKYHWWKYCEQVLCRDLISKVNSFAATINFVFLPLISLHWL